MLVNIDFRWILRFSKWKPATKVYFCHLNCSFGAVEASYTLLQNIAKEIGFPKKSIQPVYGVMGTDDSRQVCVLLDEVAEKNRGLIQYKDVAVQVKEIPLWR